MWANDILLSPEGNTCDCRGFARWAHCKHLESVLKLKELGFRWPVALTAAAWAKCVAVSSGVDCQDEVGRPWDVLAMLRFAVSKQGGPEVRFGVHVRNDNRDRLPPLVRLKAVCGPDDGGEPVVTVLMPDED